VYTSPVLKPQLADLTTLPDDLGVPVAVAVTSKETHPASCGFKTGEVYTLLPTTKYQSCPTKIPRVLASAIKEQPSYEGQTLITQSVGMDADAHVLSLALAESPCPGGERKSNTRTTGSHHTLLPPHIFPSHYDVL